MADGSVFAPGATPEITKNSYLGADCRGMNFYRADPAFQQLLDLYLPGDLRQHMEPHFDKLGALCGGRLNELSQIAEQHNPILHARDRFGQDEEWIEYHPAYKEMEKIALHDLGLHAMTNRPGVFDWPNTLPYLVKYAIQYLFVQSEFSIMCPISVSDTSAYLFLRYANDELKARYKDRLLSQDMEKVWMGAQFMTEKIGGSDVGAIESIAKFDADADDGTGTRGHWRITGEKWFCSHADADVAMILARPKGAEPGTKGLALFMMPRYLENGSKNSYRILRLKPKMGTKSMASGEIRMDGAIAYPLGRLDQGFKQMMDQVSFSRLSHGVRAAAMMRRCLNESLIVANTRLAFGQRLNDFPLMRRQLLKIMLPTEQALSMFGFTAQTADMANAGDPKSQKLLRILTPLYKFRACRDNIRVATAAMEVRGGLGYIEEWINARLVREAHIGTLWEGTSNIIGLDTITRAVGKLNADQNLQETLQQKLDEASDLPGQFRGEVGAMLDRARNFAHAAANAEGHTECRRATTALYNATTAALMAWEASKTGNGKRLLLSRLVINHRMTAQDPVGYIDDSFDKAAATLLLTRSKVSMGEAVETIEAVN